MTELQISCAILAMIDREIEHEAFMAKQSPASCDYINGVANTLQSIRDKIDGGEWKGFVE